MRTAKYPARGLALATATHQLAHRLGHVAHPAAKARLSERELAAVGVTGKIAGVRQIVFLHEGRLTEKTPVGMFFKSPRSAEAAEFLEGELPWPPSHDS